MLWTYYFVHYPIVTHFLGDGGEVAVVSRLPSKASNLGGLGRLLSPLGPRPPPLLVGGPEHLLPHHPCWGPCRRLVAADATPQNAGRHPGPPRQQRWPGQGLHHLLPDPRHRQVRDAAGKERRLRLPPGGGAYPPTGGGVPSIRPCTWCRWETRPCASQVSPLPNQPGRPDGKPTRRERRLAQYKPRSANLEELLAAAQ